MGPTTSGSEKSTPTEDFDEDSYGTDDESSGSNQSSRATTNSLDHILPKRATQRQRAASAYEDRGTRRKFNRYFSVGLGAILVLFILTLTRLSYTSAKEVEEAAQQQTPQSEHTWENFPFLERYHGGIRSLISRSANVPEYPGKKDAISSILSSTGHGSAPAANQRRQDEDLDHPNLREFNPFTNTTIQDSVYVCYLDALRTMRVPKVHAFDGVVKGFPDNVLGSYDMFGLNKEVCFDRYGRLGPYGFGYSQKYGGTGAGMEGDTQGMQKVWLDDAEVNWGRFSWADAMQKCATSNMIRFMTGIGRNSNLHIDDDPLPVEQSPRATPEESIPRQAVIIRTWTDYQYDPEDLMFLRSMFAELSLTSGTEYVVHLLIHVKDNDLQFWSDEELYNRLLNDALPEEFRGMGTLWSERQMELVYPGLDQNLFRGLGVYGNYRSTFMPVQFFAHKHPEYEQFWHWEMDIRYTGHMYHLFDRIANWAKQQPRKGLWERNARFYLPTEHGSWEDFQQMVRVQVEHGVGGTSNRWSSLDKEKPIWGPERSAQDDLDSSEDPVPPTSYEQDDYQWGVGEEADLITLNPLFDPDQTGWNLAEDVTGYNLTAGYPPRRTAIVTASRLSRRLLDTMHKETQSKHHIMFSEMWPASCALQHGLKAVYAPHPVFVDRRWPTDYMASVLNAGRNGASGGSKMTPFNDYNQHYLLGVSWYYNAGFPGSLWRRWLGYKVDGDGGEMFEMAHEGRMCLPGMLLHPVKQVDLIYEHLAGQA